MALSRDPETEENPFPALVNIVDSLRGFDAIRPWVPGGPESIEDQIALCQAHAKLQNTAEYISDA
jgi:hypothetical protein